MKQVEIELYQHPYSTAATRQVLEFKDNAKVKAILDTIKDLARKQVAQIPCRSCRYVDGMEVLTPKLTKQ